ncbi:DUF4381 domain-containing protein [Catenovulum adriaticum]|uniref:DUF4381 domain-containing protein n=1 Tax=Catenovulum adriaticum TaxID=2984846 RepID=A0ABY7ARA5_9ALTE|nr:DUF4381 domain-containing protein [Catenovulum sp. TS8]WAJ72080.1 DUF4381 domain-containing protein [Catenovulum sp. TS8]
MPSNANSTLAAQSTGTQNTLSPTAQLQNSAIDPNAAGLANPAQASDPMAAFKDLQMPDPISWWPLAWGWWVVIAISLIALAAFIYFLVQHQQKKRAKKQAIKLINQLPASATTIELNQLLKQTMLSYYPRQQVAQLSGKTWLTFLLAQLPTAKKATFNQSLSQFSQSLYQPNKLITNDDKMLITQYIKQIKIKQVSTKNTINNELSGEAKHV